MSTVSTEASGLKPRQSRAPEPVSFEFAQDSTSCRETRPHADGRPNPGRRAQVCLGLVAMQVAASLCCAVGQVVFAGDAGPTGFEARDAADGDSGAAAIGLFERRAMAAS